MDKIYAVILEDLECDSIHCYCRDLETAEKEKLKIEQKIQDIKTLYYLEYSSDFDKDCISSSESDDDCNYTEEQESIQDRLILFMTKHSELKIENIFIEERKLI